MEKNMSSSGPVKQDARAEQQLNAAPDASSSYLFFTDEEGVIQRLDLYNVKKALAVIRAINHPLRRKILSLIQIASSITVTNLIAALSLEQSVISQHLAILRKAGAVVPRRSGKQIFYSLNTEKLLQINSSVSGIISQNRNYE